MRPRPVSSAALPWAVVIVAGERRKRWGAYPTEEHAEIAARTLRKHGLDARTEPNEAARGQS